MIRSYHYLGGHIKSVLGLSFSLAKANFKLRNEGSYLGLLWYLLNPLALFFIIIFIRGEAFAHVEIPHYPMYLLIGLLMHNFFSNLVSSSISVIPSNSGFIKSIKIPHEALVISRVLQSVFSHIFELVLIVACMIYFNISMQGLLAYAGVFVLFTVFILGLSFIFSTLGVYINDLNNVWVVASQLLFFITPTFHVPAVGSLLFRINQYNPLYHFFSAAREMFIYSRLPSLETLAIITATTIVTLLIGLFVFEKKKHRFAELI